MRLQQRRRYRYPPVPKDVLTAALAAGAGEGGAALGGVIPAGVSRATPTEPSAAGRPAYSEDEPTRLANYAARSEGQRLSPYRRGPAPQLPPPLSSERVAQLIDWLGTACSAGLSPESCQRLITWLQGH
jgi:hypothetical protein